MATHPTTGHSDSHKWFAVGRLHFECSRCGLHHAHVQVNRKDNKGYARRETKRYFIRWDENEKIVRPALGNMPPCKP
jgi:ribosomal protein L37E